MKTPIYDFVKEYAASDISRLHMPGHKGEGPLGIESMDITEVLGADVLYSADGIIAESEQNATELFGTAHTYYSTEGSTLAIKAMLALAIFRKKSEKRPVVLATRNAHKAFINAAALLDFSVEWIYSDESAGHICSCTFTSESVKSAIDSMAEKPAAVYITSPDYLGNIADVAAIADVCDGYGIPLLVDNAHGAYLNFLSPSKHPIALGASMCCDSAHKTLSVLTGGAYLHIAKKAAHYTDRARSVLSIFASTSPSYLILESLDLCNFELHTDYSQRLKKAIANVEKLKASLIELGLDVQKSEELKIVVNVARFGYTGGEVSECLRKNSVEPEFFDDEYVVLMASASSTLRDYERIISAFAELKRKCPILKTNVHNITPHECAMSIRDTIFAPSERISVYDAVGRICAAPTVSCPPAIPIVISGEIIEESDIQLFLKYGITTVSVVCE